ncbi:uncharacterized protein LOC111355708 isoform X2 [Spodoptera litura]|uniref:Uncharacterized protein LOC111355708 isoform X2 n=1 Tax=Spodoptera litura TaxID=69820 RepID=A0A9J7EDM2_SPOLT|nr:uncharacterized protein LOC111355708 isoform X2 [Spodoptera litura]
MSGKPYTVSELKTIVEYLVENKLYSETRARKMWVDFANTKITNRTWQSLKETFLKRILPDIHNPYFKLTNEQISSFRARCNLAEKEKSKLEIHTISDDSSSNGTKRNSFARSTKPWRYNNICNNPKDNEPSNDEGETNAGENTKCSKIPLRNRSSADTVILEHCYDTVEDIQRDLESTEEKIEDLKQSVVNKSLRDCITYSEPLTPMLQEVLDDFASEPEDSDRENRMEIVENESVPEAENVEDIEIIHEQLPDFDNDNATTKSAEADAIENYKRAEIIEELLDQEIDSETRPLNTNSNTADESEPDLPEVVLDEEISSMHVEIHTEKSIDDSAEHIDSVAVEKEAVQPDAGKSGDTSSKNLHPEPQVQSGAINTSNSTVDASLPNNPEAFKNKQPDNVEANNKKTEESTNEVTNDTDKPQTAAIAARKRSDSEEPCNYTHKKKKRLHIQLKSSSESECKQAPETHKVSEKAKLPKVNGDAIKSQAVKMGRPKNTEDYSKPSTSAANNEVIEIEDVTTELPPMVRNPCLQTVSLFDEQFNKTRHNSSESSDNEKNKKEAVNEKPNETVATMSKEASKSRSESESEITPPPPKKKKRTGVISSKSERDKAIAKMFGVTSGGGGHSKRKRRSSHRADRARTTSHNNTSQQNATRSDPSDWTSESESEAYVSPPRGRKNRSTKKYLKPRSAKISSLEEEGGLFVMYGKRIYPVVKDGKILKNYVTFLSESDSDEEMFWKQKYVEEKKKAAELKKLLEEATEPKPKAIENNPAPAVQQPNPISTPRPSLVQVAEPSNCQAKEVPSPQVEEKKDAPKMGPERIKIKFTKNNEEVHLEGHWPQIHPVLEQVVHIFHKESETAVTEPPPKPATTNGVKELTSGLSTPIVVTVDPEVHEKVNKIEKEIFQEIEERDQEEDVKQNGVNNVTKRKQPTQRKSSSSSALVTPEKQRKISNGTDKETNQTVAKSRPRRQKAKETENKSVDNQEISPKRQTRTPRKVLNETVNTSNLKTMQTRRSKQNSETSPKEQEEVVYTLTRSKRLSLRAANNKTNKKTYKSAAKIPRIFSSPDNLAPYSMDSTQWYRDTDTSPAKPETRRKKKLDMSSFMIKTRNSLRRNSKSKTYPYLYCDAYNDSSNSSVDAPAKVARENSTLKSDAYKSDSYQHLMPQVKIVLSRHLEPIHETPPNENGTYFSKSSKEMRTEDVSAPRRDNHTNNSGQMTCDVGSSSNMSLPMSPELSIVENLSLSKELLNSAEDYPIMNEMQNTEANEPMSCNNYRISEVDVTLPLMNQECDFESCNIASEPSSGGQGLVTESLLKKIDTFNINEQVTVTDTLNKKLHDLFLESAKKVSRKQSTENKDSVMEVDVTGAPSGDVQKKAKAKKRCSTPQKRKRSKKSAAPQVDPVVEEEHVESFSHGGGRQSCPPLFQAYLGDEILTEEIDIANLSNTNNKPKGRKKKDIIRVKIQRPKHKPGHEKVHSKTAKNASRLSLFTDSGINETESEVFQPVNESVELIHNHSETCLLANECVGDSLELVENSKSVITLDDSLQSGDAWNSQTQNVNEHDTSPSPDVFCNNAQDVCLYKNGKSDIDCVSETVYHSPYGTPNSLITEDISDDSPLATRPAKWYLLSEDETNNTNLVGQGTAMLNAGSYTSNLKHIFPVTCAVPDLSTITEMSDNSRKPALEDLAGLTGDDFNSLSVFDSNFNV